jgi:hypothetical protein
MISTTFDGEKKKGEQKTDLLLCFTRNSELHQATCNVQTIIGKYKEMPHWYHVKTTYSQLFRLYNLSLQQNHSP